MTGLTGFFILVFNPVNPVKKNARSAYLGKETYMMHGKKIIVVLPAYNAEKTLRQTYEEIPHEIADEVILTDDASHDRTVEVARELGIETFVHLENKGYGANQKTCYQEALKRDADIIIMLHPDYQYTPRLITAMAAMIACGEFDIVLASRILGKGALSGGMPLYKYISNRFLTAFENIMFNQKLSEYHTGYRAFSRDVLLALPLAENSNDFVFDNEILAQIIYFGFRIGEISCPTKYFDDASSISFKRSVTYGINVLRTSLKFVIQKLGLNQYPLFDPKGRRLDVSSVINEFRQ